MKRLTLLITALICTQVLLAQNAHFTTSGTVEFERRINMFAMIKKQIDKDNESYMQPVYDAYVKNNPQFKTLKSVLTFSKDKALFTPIIEEAPAGNSGVWSAAPTIQQNNVTYTDLTTGLSITQKKAFEEVFLVKDSTRKINWKITDEKREIAGYNCRRANAIIMDSVYVVAFYCDDIPVSAGPESFSGLPGMILGVALPHDNITWFATRVTDMPVPENKVAPPAKGKVVNNKQLRSKLDEAMDNWGAEGKSYVKILML